MRSDAKAIGREPCSTQMDQAKSLPTTQEDKVYPFFTDQFMQRANDTSVA